MRFFLSLIFAVVIWRAFPAFDLVWQAVRIVAGDWGGLR
jgi:hypothetical protein